MDEQQWLASRFEEHRPRLRAVAYRMLGSLTEADDAVQDAWERVSRAGAGEVQNLSGWLTTIVARICLNTLRSRNARREEFIEALVPDPIVTADGEASPEDEALMADSVGLASPPGGARYSVPGRAPGLRASRHVRSALR